MPHLANPEAGFIATANNKPVGDGTTCFLGTDWMDGHPEARIAEELGARRDWDLPKVQALQMDQRSIPWRELRDTVLALPGETAEVRRALDLLKAWDGVVAAGSSAATIFEFFVTEMAQRVVKAKASRAVGYALGDQGFTPLFPASCFVARRVGHLVRLLHEQPEGWFAHSWSQEMESALAAALTRLQKDYGERIEAWAWGGIRPLRLKHPVGARKPFDKVFNLGPVPWGGDFNTVNQGGSHIGDCTGDPVVIPSMRMVIDVGNWENNRFSLPGGQSGNPLSPHYDDLLPFWRRGDGVAIAWAPEQVSRVARSIVSLVPTVTSPRSS